MDKLSPFIMYTLWMTRDLYKRIAYYFSSSTYKMWSQHFLVTAIRCMVLTQWHENRIDAQCWLPPFLYLQININDLVYMQTWIMHYALCIMYRACRNWTWHFILVHVQMLWAQPSAGSARSFISLLWNKNVLQMLMFHCAWVREWAREREAEWMRKGIRIFITVLKLLQAFLTTKL